MLQPERRRDAESMKEAGVGMASVTVAAATSSVPAAAPKAAATAAATAAGTAADAGVQVKGVEALSNAVCGSVG